jgi:hypothetical protein
VTLVDVSRRLRAPIDVAQARRVVLIASGIMLILKLYVVFSTAGTNDIKHWVVFTNLAQRWGPVDMYAHHVPGNLYNHPPLMGYFLEVVNGARNIGIPVRVSIRLVSSLADVATTMIVFRMIATRRGARIGMLAGLLVAVSPVLFTISAFHGNTDPIFTMFALLSVYLLADRQRPGWAGLAIGLAVGVKIVAVVAVPSLLIYAWRRGRYDRNRFCVAAFVTVLVTWAPAVIFQWSHLKANVLSYPGLGLGQWGLVQFGHYAGDPFWVGWLTGGGRLVIVALCALLPAVLVLRRPERLLQAVAVALAMFLALSPAFAVQYLAWGAAATVVIGLWWGLLYNATAGVLLFHEYARWSGAFPWTDKMAFYHPATPNETAWAVGVWAFLVGAVIHGIVQSVRSPAPGPTSGEGEATSARTFAGPEDRHLARQAWRGGRSEDRTSSTR